MRIFFKNLLYISTVSSVLFSLYESKKTNHNVAGNFVKVAVCQNTEIMAVDEPQNRVLCTFWDSRVPATWFEEVCTGGLSKLVKKHDKKSVLCSRKKNLLVDM